MSAGVRSKRVQNRASCTIEYAVLVISLGTELGLGLLRLKVFVTHPRRFSDDGFPYGLVLGDFWIFRVVMGLEAFS